MSWIRNNATELTAIGSIFMDVSTLVIIFFNLNQLKLSSRSFNVDINFKVFELRKNIYKDASTWITDDQSALHSLGERRNEIVKFISDFKAEQFLPDLNVANFHQNLM